jgi:hypothetical protein
MLPLFGLITENRVLAGSHLPLSPIDNGRPRPTERMEVQEAM